MKTVKTIELSQTELSASIDPRAIDARSLKTKQTARQGDVLVTLVTLDDVRVRKIIFHERLMRSARRDLVRGVRNSHIAQEPAIVYEGRGGVYVYSPGDWLLWHDEHAPQYHRPGLFRIERQREGTEWGYSRHVTD